MQETATQMPESHNTLPVILSRGKQSVKCKSWKVHWKVDLHKSHTLFAILLEKKCMKWVHIFTCASLELGKSVYLHFYCYLLSATWFYPLPQPAFFTPSVPRSLTAHCLGIFKYIEDYIQTPSNVLTLLYKPTASHSAHRWWKKSETQKSVAWIFPFFSSLGTRSRWLVSSSVLSCQN